MKPTPERVLITGGTGFIGAALVRALVAAGHEVHLISRSKGPSPRLLDVQDRCVTLQANLLDTAAVRQAVEASSPEIIYHLAAAGVSASGQFDRASLLRTNVLGTANLLEALEGRFYRSLVYAGTGAEYGPSSEAIVEESPLRPSSDYAVAKAAGALLCQTEARRGWPVVVVRIFGAYGPGEAPQRLIPYVMGCCQRGEVAKVSCGLQRRDWVFIDDVVELLQVAAHTPRAAGQVLHAATGREHTVRQAIETILDVCASSTRIVYGAETLRPGEPERYLGDICRTRALTGWQPRFDLQAGIERTWEWFRANEPEPILRRAG
jgi:nucleoside-diphosphate-sugar epimerase